MTAIVKDGQYALTMVQAQAQALELALKAAATLKSARGLLPDALKSEGEIVAVLLAGQELGLPPMAALRGLQVVKGKIVISYDTMIALLRRDGYRIEWLTSTATEATLRLTAPDKTVHVETWTQERAKRAGLWGSGTWGKYPDTMLKARCVSSAARAFAGEVLAGVYCEESGEREEIAGPRVVEMRREERAPAPRGEIIDAEASCGAGEGSCGEASEPAPAAAPSAPRQLSECADAAAIAAWVAANAAKLREASESTRAKTRDRVAARAAELAAGLGLAGDEALEYQRGAVATLEAALAA